jgi:hypothetical protein
MNDRLARAYLTIIFDRMETGDRTVYERAERMITLWLKQPGFDRRYADTWRELLKKPVKDIRATVLGKGDRADALRHTMPFVGILTNREIADLRRQYPGLSHTDHRSAGA